MLKLNILRKLIIFNAILGGKINWFGLIVFGAIVIIIILIAKILFTKKDE